MNLSVITLVLGLLVASGCCMAQAGAKEGEVKKAGNDVAQFALDFYQRLAAGKGNIFVSPYSVHSALGMTLTGAKGETAGQMQTVLHVQDAQSAAKEYRELVRHLREVKKQTEFELNIANAIWGDRSLQFLPQFTQLLTRQYDSKLRQVDFRANPEGAREQINSWVSDETKRKIPELIPSGILGTDTRLVLTNAIYFKAAWESQFKKQATQDGDFWASGTDRVQVKMMKQTFSTRYAEDDAVQMVELPYKGGAESMLILLPRQRDGLGAIEKQLSAAGLDALYAQGTRKEVRLTMPSFKVRQQVELKPVLMEMGMPNAFTDAADFSGMTEQARLGVSNVIHEAYVAVDEEGTEAAAATAVGMKLMAMPAAQPVTFTADHPFFFVIRDNASGAILFAGRLVQPERQQ